MTQTSDSDSGHYSIESLHPPQVLTASQEEKRLSSSENAPDKIESSDNPVDASPVVVPLKNRRGLFSSVCLVPELTDARQHSERLKKFIVTLIASAAFAAPVGTSIFLPAMENVASNLNTTEDIVNTSFGIYMLSLGIFPLWWSALSELYGRRTVYIISFTLFVGFNIGCALCKSIESLIVLRLLSGGSAASVQAVGAGTISDIYTTERRGRAMGYYYLGPLCGPLVAPIFGGLMNAKWGWRSTMWFMAIVGSITLVVMTLFLPETLRKELVGEIIENIDYTAPENAAGGLPMTTRIVSHLSQEYRADSTENNKFLGRIYHAIQKQVWHNERNQENETWSHRLYVILVLPLRGLNLFRYPPVPLTIAYSTSLFFTLYFLNISIQHLYSSSPYNWSSILIGLAYLPNSVGYFISSVGNGYWSDMLINRAFQKYGRYIPETRLGPNLYLSAAILPFSLLLFGWTAQYHTFWVAPLFGTFIFGMCSMVAAATVATYLIDSLPGKGSTGIALNNLLRMVSAAIATFVAAPLQRAMGYGWLYTMLAIICYLAFGGVLLLKRRGPYYREAYDVTSFY